MTTLVRLGMLVPPFRSRHEPGQARTGRAGGHTSDGAWSHTLVSGHKPVRSRAPSRGPAAQADSSRDDTNGQGGSAADLPARPVPSSGTTNIFTGGSGWSAATGTVRSWARTPQALLPRGRRTSAPRRVA